MFLVEVSFKYNEKNLANHLCNASDPIETIMKNFFESYLKNHYRDWMEAREFLNLKGIKRKKHGQLLNIGENSQEIHEDYWVNPASDFTKIDATFGMKPAESFFKTITCNA